MNQAANDVMSEEKVVFLCLPMKGRSEEDILFSVKKMSLLVKRKLGRHVKIVHNYASSIEDPEASKVRAQGLWYLGKAFQLLSKSDYLVYVKGVKKGESNGCDMEKLAAKLYGIETFGVGNKSFVCPDILK